MNNKAFVAIISIIGLILTLLTAGVVQEITKGSLSILFTSAFLGSLLFLSLTSKTPSQNANSTKPLTYPSHEVQAKPIIQAQIKPSQATLIRKVTELLQANQIRTKYTYLAESDCRFG